MPSIYFQFSLDLGSISAASLGPAFLPEKKVSVGSFPEQRLVIKPSLD